MSGHWFIALPAVAAFVGVCILGRVSPGLRGIIVVLDVALVAAIIRFVDRFDGEGGQSAWDEYTIGYTVLCALPVIRVLIIWLRRYWST